MKDGFGESQESDGECTDVWGVGGGYAVEESENTKDGKGGELGVSRGLKSFPSDKHAYILKQDIGSADQDGVHHGVGMFLVIRRVRGEITKAWWLVVFYVGIVMFKPSNTHQLRLKRIPGRRRVAIVAPERADHFAMWPITPGLHYRRFPAQGNGQQR